MVHELMSFKSKNEIRSTVLTVTVQIIGLKSTFTRWNRKKQKPRVTNIDTDTIRNLLGNFC